MNFKIQNHANGERRFKNFWHGWYVQWRESFLFILFFGTEIFYFSLNFNDRWCWLQLSLIPDPIFGTFISLFDTQCISSHFFTWEKRKTGKSSLGLAFIVNLQTSLSQPYKQGPGFLGVQGLQRHLLLLFVTKTGNESIKKKLPPCLTFLTCHLFHVIEFENSSVMLLNHSISITKGF